MKIAHFGATGRAGSRIVLEALERGQRTGKFRLDKDRLLTLPNGESKISMEDFAIAMIDELENPRHVRQRFTVGY